MHSNLTETLQRAATRSAGAVVGRTRIAVNAVNALLARRLAAPPGSKDALLADPVFEAARTWKPAPQTFGDLSGTLLDPRMVDALDMAQRERMPRDRHPYAHQVEAWEAARQGLSYLVCSGTGSGKTECFMVPLLDDLLRDHRSGQLVGVRAIILYPLNALIESQRERLAAWTEGLADRIHFALYNGETPERPRDVTRPTGVAELGDRRSIRETPPAILVTNITMLEFSLLRAQDRSLLEASQGLLRWIVLDEAHGYVGAQAAELALLLRRVRAAFGVAPEQVQLVATSATISEGESTREKLTQFVADLAGHGCNRVCIIEGQTAEPLLPTLSSDAPLPLEGLEACNDNEAWRRLASHPRIQELKRQLCSQPLPLAAIARSLFDDPARRDDAQRVLDAAGRARATGAHERLLPWRAHLFHRALGGMWVCVDPECPHRDPELLDDPEWLYGALWLHPRDHCDCGALTFELKVCGECGAPHLLAHRSAGATVRLTPSRAVELDEFAVDEEPETSDEGTESTNVRDVVYLRAVDSDTEVQVLDLATGTLYDNAPAPSARTVAIRVIEDPAARGCCDGAWRLPRLLDLHLGPAFFIGAIGSDLLEGLATPLDEPGLPLGGRRALTFSDSRQGVARLAAKLQQEAERTLTRSFLYHSVQAGQDLSEQARYDNEDKLAKLRQIDPDGSLFAFEIEAIERALANDGGQVAWGPLVDKLSRHDELVAFATDVWKDRGWGANRLGEDPALLARMFLFRELARRPRIQNNAETLGLVRLIFPALHDAARNAVPELLRAAGVDGEGYAGLAQAAVDLVFRDTLSVELPDSLLIRWVSPRRARLQAIAAPTLARHEWSSNTRPWPEARAAMARVPRMVALVARLLRADLSAPAGRDRVNGVLAHLWELVRRYAATDSSGRNCWQLNFNMAAVARVGPSWRCPITRRVFGYSPAGISPYAGATGGELTSLEMPRLPHANALGLAGADREAVADWCASDSLVADLRRNGLWTDFHDRIATYPRFLRAQEHSAQIDREVLRIYEDSFKKGRINFLNCSTTMEMGIDLPNVGLVVNANLPPSVSNYRQRVGRAGRRGEPWAFAMTFCRDQPLDQDAFRAPQRFLEARIVAPCVRLDSAPIVMRHVNAALLAAFVSDQPEGLRISQTIGDFFGAADDPNEPVLAGSAVDTFVARLREDSFAERQVEALTNLLRDTALAKECPAALCVAAADAIEDVVTRWRYEHLTLLLGSTSSEQDVAEAYRKRARRMRGEFLLSEMARRGFTPAYGFPVDVVRFDHAAERDRRPLRMQDGRESARRFGAGYYASGSARTLDIALREYAPGAEVVIDGFVHRSEGVQPAWASNADASHLEDLQTFWQCGTCAAFGLTRASITECPHCGTAVRSFVNTLRPTGFLGRREPHTGYEVIAQAPYEMPHVSAAGAPWRALPDPETGRVRVSAAGQIVTLSASASGYGYAVCLACGRAAPENEPMPSAMHPAMREHAPLAPLRGDERVGSRYCPGGTARPQRVQRNIHLVHATTTDVFEWLLPRSVTRAKALALGAGLREVLANRLGAEARELGVALTASGDGHIALFLYDRAARGAGMATRLGEHDVFVDCLVGARDKLDCAEKCSHGCSACVLRPDLCYSDEPLDRRGGHALAADLARRLDLPPALRVFGEDTQYLGQPVAEALQALARRQPIDNLTVYLYGQPQDWELDVGPLAAMLEDGLSVRPTLAIATSSRLHARFGLTHALALFRHAVHADIAEVPELPLIDGFAMLVTFRQGSRFLAIAAPEAAAVAGPNWGNGVGTPIVLGPTPRPADVTPLDIAALVTSLAGGAKLYRITRELDGPIDRFGQRFWDLVGTLAPALVDAMEAHGVAKVSYRDRYLVTPLAIRLVTETLQATPGRRATTAMRVLTMRIERTREGREPWRFDQFFQSEDIRTQVLESLISPGTVECGPRHELAHERVLVIELTDGRVATINLDHGFGAWRIRSGLTLRHPFHATAVAQADCIRNARFHVDLPAQASTPMVINVECAT